jgi:hypothetical protein
VLDEFAQDKLKSTGQQLAQAQGRNEAAHPSARHARAGEASATGTPALGAAGMGCRTCLYDWSASFEGLCDIQFRAATENETSQVLARCKNKGGDFLPETKSLPEICGRVVLAVQITNSQSLVCEMQ